MDLPLLTSCFATLALSFYVVLDGFDLGVGILLFIQRAQTSRDHMVDSITPTWDGNETWLIMAGVSLLAAFPLAYSVLMPAFYLPVILMLLGLGLRGVSFEFRVQMKHRRRRWDYVFASGSLLAAYMQGIIVGGLLQGVDIRDLRFAGSVLDVFRPFPLLSGAAVVAGYCVLGAGWLRLKAQRLLEQFAFRALRLASILFAVLLFVACIAAGNFLPGVHLAWAAHHLILSALLVAIGSLLVALIAMPEMTRAGLVFLESIGLFLLCLAGLARIVYPDIVPYHLTLWDAAASATSQKFVLIGVALVAPVVLAYSAYAYWVFRGRTPAQGWE